MQILLIRREQNRKIIARVVRTVNTDTKAYIFPGDSPMISEDVGGQEQKGLQRQKTDCRPATFNFGQTQMEKIYGFFQRMHMRKRQERGSWSTFKYIRYFWPECNPFATRNHSWTSVPNAGSQDMVLYLKGDNFDQNMPSRPRGQHALPRAY